LLRFVKSAPQLLLGCLQVQSQCILKQSQLLLSFVIIQAVQLRLQNRSCQPSRVYELLGGQQIA
jgi:hypothetical protein